MVGGWEIPRIEQIAALERRRLARLPVPGLLGDLQQDLGSDSVVVEIVGSLSGDEARDDFLQSVREKFRDGSPVGFVADIATATKIDQVLIEELEVAEANDAADSFHYRIVLREYVEPPAPPPALDDLGADLGLDLDSLASLGLDGLKLPDLLSSIPSLGNPVEPVKGALAGVSSATAPVAGLLDGLKGKFL